LLAWYHWLTLIILATQEVEIRRILVQSQPRQIAHKNLSQKTHHKKKKKKKKWAGGVAQGIGTEFKPFSVVVVLAGHGGINPST
jgi:hypothetical protein